MERITPNAPTQGTHGIGALPHGRGWAVVATDAGFLLRLLVSGAELRVSEAEVQALKRGEVTGEALLERAGMALPTPHAPQAPIYGTTVSISAEGRRRAGQGGNKDPGAGGAGAGGQGAGRRPSRPKVEWIAAGALIALLLLGWMIGVFG